MAAKPIGRRIFLGLMGAGVAGLLYERWVLRDDDVTSTDVATAVPVPPGGGPVQRETIEGQHPNTTFTERFRYYSVGNVPSFNERTWRLRVDGVGLESTLDLRYVDVKGFPNFAERSTFRCVTGWRVPNNIWRGVRLSYVI